MNTPKFIPEQFGIDLLGLENVQNVNMVPKKHDSPWEWLVY